MQRDHLESKARGSIKVSPARSNVRQGNPVTNWDALDCFSGPGLTLHLHGWICSITSSPFHFQNILASENLTSRVWTHTDEQAWNQPPFYRACLLDKQGMRRGRSNLPDKPAKARLSTQTRAIPYLASQKVRIEAPPAPCPLWLSWLSTKTRALSEGTKPQPSPQFLAKNTDLKLPCQLL